MKHNFLWDIARATPRKALPILSFPAAQKLGVDVEALIKSAELQAQAMTYVANQTPAAAAVSLMDLSVEAEAFGANVRFSKTEVPCIIGQLVDDADAAHALKVPSLDIGRALLCVEAVRLARARITAKPLLAGVIGPYSLAGRLMDVTEIMYTCYDEPETVHTVLEKATEYIINYINAFKRAGADGVVMAEPLAGLLNAHMAREFSCEYAKRIIDAVQTDTFLVVYHNCGGAVPGMLNELFDMNAAAYHFGNAVNLPEILKNTPSDALVMGNIDPAGQFAQGTPESIRAATRALIEKCANFPNHILSSGCDIPAHAKWENINAFFEAAAQ